MEGEPTHGQFKGHSAKDAFTEQLVKITNLTFTSSSQMVNQICIFDILKNKYNYKNLDECFEDRRNHREEWYNLICDYNKEDKSRLTKEIIKTNNIYVGMRDDKEYEYSRHLFDLIIWVDAFKRVFEKDDTLKIDFKTSNPDIIINNNGTIDQLKDYAKLFGKINNL